MEQHNNTHTATGTRPVTKKTGPEMVLSNNTSLSEYWNSYRTGQGCNGTRRNLVPLQPSQLRCEFQYSDNDVLMSYSVY